MPTVKCKAEFRTDDDVQLTAGAATAFLDDLPTEAEVFPVTVEKGTQRDPWPVLVGLRATWEESR